METQPNPPLPLPDLTVCDREPIHLPGSIQPYGCLLALSGERLRIVQATPTCRALLGMDVAGPVGRELGETLGRGLEQSVREALARHRVMPAIPAGLTWQPPGDGSALAGYVHQSGSLVVLELEPLIGDDPAGAADPAPAMSALNWVRAEPGLEAKAQAVAALLQQLTGFDRVMVYRFDLDWHGEVIAESRAMPLEPYLGLHYPASDIPAQARQLYLVNPTRVIADRDAVQSPILAVGSASAGAPLDLTKSLLRSVSPVHLEYLRNMGVRASLSSALIRDGALWGLISCHHARPRRLGRGLRELLGWMVQDLATQLALAEEVRTRHYAARLKVCRNNVISAMRAGARLSSLMQGPELKDVLGAIGADGAALIRGSELTIGGVAPHPARIRAIVDGLTGSCPDDPSGVFLTDCLSRHVPAAADLAPIAAGLALFPLVGSPLVKLMWFRGEQVRLVTWAGNPDKATDQAADGRIGPRKSFAAWTETVRQRSLPWTAEEVESARHLTALVDIELHKTVEDALRASLADVQRHDAWMVGLNRMNDRLLSCETRSEAEAIIAQGAADLFAAHPGALALRQDDGPELRLAASWGDGWGLPAVLALRDCWALRRGETYEVADPATGVHCPHVQDRPGRSYLCVPLTVRGETLGLLHLVVGADAPGAVPAVPLGELRTLAQAVGESIKLVLSNLRLQTALRDQAIRNPLTGLFNRRYLDETLPREIHSCRRRQEPLVIAVLALDWFTLCNDDHGPAVGDQALRAIGGLINRLLRGGDIACRYAGDAFALLLPDTSLEDARGWLDGLRQALTELRLSCAGVVLSPVSVCIGVAALAAGETDAALLLARADAALCQAKVQGPNRVVVAGA
ncbi:diguanylate cyclase [uncultured Thiodictyon sp.]|uniref:sensor domain-containing diguanylate cyclase n=1 Tax=uncultured Thiodictyon sp. TaxID=1846217 RepID=UPI0025EE33FB|nr:diguanylate cyclase [uncultured Thiodictyon sp.]